MFINYIEVYNYLIIMINADIWQNTILVCHPVYVKQFDSWFKSVIPIKQYVPWYEKYHTFFLHVRVVDKPWGFCL